MLDKIDISIYKMRKGIHTMLSNPAAGSAQGIGEASRRILVAVTAEHVVGRRILEGIADYTNNHKRWQNFLELSGLGAPIQERRIDGMIIASELLHLPKFQYQHDIPTIRVTGASDMDGTPAVTVDNHAVGRMGANYLVNLGLKQLAFVPWQGPFSDHRAEGFSQICQTRNLEYTVIDPKQANDPDQLRQAIEALPDPCGIMVATDRKALEVSRICRLIGRRIPEQVALLGVDDETEICRLVDPPLTSIDHGPRRIGYEAARLLDQWVSTGRPPERSLVVQPIRVVARQSTDLLAIDNPDVVIAIRFIRSHFDHEIKVKDVLKHVAMSRRSLEMHFRAALGRSIHEEILRVRIERARQLLATSDQSMAQLASECGFALASQFSFVFKRETGEAPSAYRSRHRYSRP